MLSVVAICKNEINNAAAFVKSWSRVADEIIVVDTGSTDGTFEALDKICQSNDKLRVHRYAWHNSFSEARNHASGLALGKWIIWADMDDRLDDNSVYEIKSISKTAPDRCIGFQVASDMGEGKWQRFLQIRMYPNFPSMKFSGRVHESLKESTEANLIPVEYNPEVIIAHLGYKDEAERKRKAIRNLGLLMETDPETCDQFAYIGDALFVLGKFQAGAGYYAKAAKIGGKEVAKAIADKLAIGYMNWGKLDMAEDALSLLERKSATRLFWLGEIRILQGRYAEAADCFAECQTGTRTFENREDNFELLVSMANKRLEELKQKCVPA